MTTTDNVLFVINKKTDSNNFVFQCQIEQDYAKYIAEISFLNAIRSRQFTEKNNGTGSTVTPIILVEMLGKAITQLIENHEYKIESPFSTNNGILISFSHPFLNNTYLLHIQNDFFDKQINTNVGEENTSVIIQELFNKCNVLEKKLKSLTHEIYPFSRIQFVNSGYWEHSPFDLNYSHDELFDENGTIRDELAKEIIDNSKLYRYRYILNKYSENSFLIPTLISLFPNNKIPTNDTAFLSVFNKTDILKYSPYFAKQNELRIEFKDGNWYLKGQAWIKSKTFQTQKIQSNRSGVTIDSLNEFVFSKEPHILGTIFDKNIPDLVSYRFFIMYGYNLSPSLNDHHYYGIHQIHFKNKTLTLKTIDGIQGSYYGQQQIWKGKFQENIGNFLYMNQYEHANCASIILTDAAQNDTLISFSLSLKTVCK